MSLAAATHLQSKFWYYCSTLQVADSKILQVAVLCAKKVSITVPANSGKAFATHLFGVDVNAAATRDLRQPLHTYLPIRCHSSDHPSTAAGLQSSQSSATTTDFQVTQQSHCSRVTCRQAMSIAHNPAMPCVCPNRLQGTRPAAPAALQQQLAQLRSQQLTKTPAQDCPAGSHPTAPAAEPSCRSSPG